MTAFFDGAGGSAQTLGALARSGELGSVRAVRTWRLGSARAWFEHRTTSAAALAELDLDAPDPDSIFQAVAEAERSNLRQQLGP